MSPKTPDPRQFSLFGGDEPPDPAVAVRKHRDGLIAQIKRDMETLAMPDVCCPGPEFYRQRIERYRAAALKLTT